MDKIEKEKLKKQLKSDFRLSIDISRLNGYSPIYFERMVNNENNPIKVAKKLINSKNTQSGLHRMKTEKLKQYSVEEIVLKEKYRELFTKKEIEICKKRLEDIK